MITKKHKCKKCKKPHKENIPIFPFAEFRFLRSEQNIYIDHHSVYKMLDNAGLHEQARRFMGQVIISKFKKEE